MTDSTLTIRPPLWLPIVVVLIAAGGYAYGQKISADAVRAKDNPAMIAVDGMGKASATPDVAVLSFGVDTGRQPTAKAAMNMLASKMDAVLAAVKAKGVKDSEIQLQYLSLNPDYDWTTGTQQLRGYRASQNVTVKVHDLDLPGDILAVATEGGANQIGGVEITIDNPDEAKAAAREEAIKNAKEKAEKLARQLGVHIVRMTSFSESGGPMPPVMYDKTMMYESRGVGGAVAPAPIPTGDQEISVSVNISYEVE